MPSLHSSAPFFELPGVLGADVRTYRLSDCRRRWCVLFFYPADFSFVCPTEIRGFEERISEVRRLGCEILGISTDGVESHRLWAKELGGVSFPLLSDAEGRTARDYGVLDPKSGRAFRATFVIDPEGAVAYAVQSPVNVGRSVAETLRVLQALQTRRLCPVDWKPGEPTGEA